MKKQSSPLQLAIDKMPIQERISRAEHATQRVVQHVMDLLLLHANNEHIVYSPVLSAQIPESRAANAFNAFQSALHRFEIVRLCALWDGAHSERDLDKENVCLVVALIDSPEVIEELANKIASQWNGLTGGIINLSGDPKVQAIERDEFQRSEQAFGQQQATKARQELREAVAASRALMSSARLSSVMNIRDKHLAHSLGATGREKRGPVSVMKYGDEKAILFGTLLIVESLYRWINGAGFSFSDSLEIDRENAAALWTRCKLDIRD